MTSSNNRKGKKTEPRSVVIALPTNRRRLSFQSMAEFEKKCEEKKVENGFVLFLLLVCLLVGFYHNGGGGVSEFIACKDTRTHINTLTYRNGWRKCVGCRLWSLSLLMLFWLCVL